MLTIQTRRPSTLPAARIRVTHEPKVGRGVFVALPAPAADCYGITVSAIGGGVLPVAQARFTGQARGVPPRGRPV